MSPSGRYARRGTLPYALTSVCAVPKHSCANCFMCSNTDRRRISLISVGRNEFTNSFVSVSSPLSARFALVLALAFAAFSPPPDPPRALLAPGATPFAYGHSMLARAPTSRGPFPTPAIDRVRRLARARRHRATAARAQPARARSVEPMRRARARERRSARDTSRRYDARATPPSRRGTTDVARSSRAASSARERRPSSYPMPSRLSGCPVIILCMIECYVSFRRWTSRRRARGREGKGEGELTGYDYNATTRHTTDDA